MLGRWLLRSDPAALAQARQGWESSQAPAGTAGMGAGGACQEHSSQGQSSSPSPLQGAAGLLDLCQVLHQARPAVGAGGTGKPTSQMGSPPPSHQDWPVPQHFPSLSPPGQSCQQTETGVWGVPEAPPWDLFLLQGMAQPWGPIGPCANASGHDALS